MSAVGSVTAILVVCLVVEKLPSTREQSFAAESSLSLYVLGFAPGLATVPQVAAPSHNLDAVPELLPLPVMPELV